MIENTGNADLASCPSCGTQWGPGVLACPGCSRLVHAEALKTLNQSANQAASEDDAATALMHWRHALELLPPSSRQYVVVSARIDQLSKLVDASALPAKSASQSIPVGDLAKSPKGKSGWGKGLAGVGAICALLFKFKFILVFLLTKAKLLVLGLGKATTFVTMLASFGVYWAEWGWKFGLGLVVSIYVHEMGHVAALRLYGLPASAPMFIPGFGAFVRLKQHPANAREDARIGMAGPIWGTAAALITYGVGQAMHWPAWLAIAHVAAWINLFNLLPIWQLDGSRAFRSLDRTSQILLLAVLAVSWHYTNEGLLTLILIVAGFRMITGKPSPEPDYITTVQFCGLVAILSVMCIRAVPL